MKETAKKENSKKVIFTGTMAEWFALSKLFGGKKLCNLFDEDYRLIKVYDDCSFEILEPNYSESDIQNYFS